MDTTTLEIFNVTYVIYVINYKRQLITNIVKNDIDENITKYSGSNK